MRRRDTLKLLLLGAVGSELTTDRASGATQSPTDASFSSEWHRWPDMRWVGPEYWGNRLQDWRIRGGLVECQQAANRTLHCLTRRLGAAEGEFLTSVSVELPPDSREGYVGFRVGAKGPYDDVRSAAVFGEGLDAGLTVAGELFINDVRGSERASLDGPLRLELDARPFEEHYRLELRARSLADQRLLARVVSERVSPQALVGNVALVSHFTSDGDSGAPGPGFSHWQIGGSKPSSDDGAAFGPIAFAQYTLHRNRLKLTAQLAPIDAIEDVQVSLEVRVDGSWSSIARALIDRLSRTAHFRVDWKHDREVSYRVRVSIPIDDARREFFYSGTIAKEPEPAVPLRVAVFSCNADHGFPDAEVVEHASQHRPDLAVFLGDQFYESTSGFGIQTSPVEEATLDVLRKWMMFGWSYRELFRHIPVATIPDDHDVYHGNIWGEGGKRAPTQEGFGYVAQDQGGFKMPAAWVNAVQRMQTSHLPDAYDPTPVRQGIDVYYTQWDYGGVSFAILEDRKFKSAPGNVLPPEAQVVNGWIQNPGFDVSQHRELSGAELLGAGQMKFIETWSRDWSGEVTMKAVLSQTNFAAVHTIPESASSGAVIPDLPMPEPGDYVVGDKRSVDLDSNGWPQNERDAVLRILRRCSAFHIAGDQHLATVVRHGIEDFDDAGYTFTGPALNNIWPRRWWPPVSLRLASLSGAPDYCGQFFDGFGNRVTVHAAANPRNTGLEPAILRNRVTGYGMVVFDNGAGTIRIECWPRHADPSGGDAGQYEGWPITVRVDDEDGRRQVGWLPWVELIGIDAATIELLDPMGEVVLSRRVSQRYRPPAFADVPHTVRVVDPAGEQWQERTNVRMSASVTDVLRFDFN